MRDKLEGIDRIVDRMANQTEKELQRRYGASLRNLRRILRELYDQYARDGILSMDEMGRYNRVDKAHKKFEKELRELVNAKNREIRQTLRDTFRESYYRSAWAVEAETLAKLGYSSVKREVVQEAIQNPISGLKLNDRLERHRSDIIGRIQETTTQGLVRGESYNDMSGRLRGELEGDLDKAYRIVRTECHRVQEAGKHKSLQHAFDKGVSMKKRWVSSRDERVRDTHVHMDGQTVRFDEDFENPNTGGRGPTPGQLGVAEDDINCRCIYVVEEVRAPADRREHPELADMSYEDWRGERVA